jgi:RNA polymerase sigma-70 factor (ECF subfamily)
LENEPSDAELVERFNRGDPAAFDTLVRRYVRLAGAIAFNVLGDYEQAADAVQESFLKLHAGLGQLREPAKLKGWLYGVVRSCALDEVRRRKRRPGPLSSVEGADEILPAEGPGPGSGAERRELEAGVLAAIRELPESYREVVLMKYVEGASYKEIAETLGITVETIESRLFRARKIQKGKLSGFVEGEAK